MTRANSWNRLPANIRLASRTIRRAAPREYSFVIAASAVSSLAMLTLILIGGELLERLSSQAPPTSLRSLGPLLIALGIAAAAAAVASALQTERRWLLGHLVERETASGIVNAAASVPLAEFESPDFQDHLQRTLQHAMHRPWEVAQGLSQLVASVFASAALAVVLFTIQPILVPALLLASVPAAWAARRNGQTLYDATHALTPVNRERYYLQQVLTGRNEAKEVRAFDASGYLLGRYDDCYRREIEALRRVTRLRSRRSIAAGVGSTVVMITVMTGLLALAVRGSVSLADAAVGAVAVQQLAARVRGSNTAVGAIQEASLFLEDYADFIARALGAPLPVPASASTRGGHATDALVELDDVWFTYPGSSHPTLRGICLTIEPGSVVALVGANGSGKSTLAKLLCNLYTPDHGVVRWNQGPDGTSPHPMVSAIFQDFGRYELSARDNVALSDTRRFSDGAHVVRSARAANADGFLEALPEGYETWLSPSFEGGTDLSVGQWQRVAMARAVFREAPLVVLDEPTAALDPTAERRLIEKTSQMFADRAVLVISHRFANVVDADHIYVLEEGRIIEHGTHDELLERKGRYADMFDLQATPFTEARP